jgi:hypothetical protein
MHTGKQLRAGIHLILATLLIVSCAKKNNLDSTNPTNSKTTNGLLLQPTPAITPPIIRLWLSGPNIPLPAGTNWTGRFSMASFSVMGKGYLVAGGLMDANQTQGSSTNTLCYDTVTGTWSQKASFPGFVRTGTASFAINNLGYVCTGVGADYATASNENWQYNSKTNTWTRKAPLPGVTRSYAVGAGLNGKGYVGTGAPTAGGVDGGLKDWWEYDPATDHWTQKLNLPSYLGRWGAVAFANDQPGGKVYLGTGVEYPYGPGLGDLWEYDPVADTWTGMPGPPSGTPGRIYAVGMSLPQGGVVGTGYNGWNYNDFIMFNYSTKTWSTLPAINGQRFLAQGFAIGHYVYVGGGLYGLGDNPPVPKNDFYSLYW